MHLLIIRHGPAGDRAEWSRTGNPDDERPLTVEGRELMRLAAPALASLVPRIDVLATSPLARAWQTAEIVAAAYEGIPWTIVPSLASGGDADAVLEWLRDQKPGATIAIVGHNPDLEDFASWMLDGRHAAFVRLRKGGAARIDFEGVPVPGSGVLQWLMGPRQMRAIAASEGT